jgi:hypothetical protein
MHSPNVLPHLIVPRTKAPALTLARRSLRPRAPVHRAKVLDLLGRVAVLPVAAEVGLPPECQFCAEGVEAFKFAEGGDLADDGVGGAGVGGAGDAAAAVARREMDWGSRFAWW